MSVMTLHDHDHGHGSEEVVRPYILSVRNSLYLAFEKPVNSIVSQQSVICERRKVHFLISINSFARPGAR